MTLSMSARTSLLLASLLLSLGLGGCPSSPDTPDAVVATIDAFAGDDAATVEGDAATTDEDAATASEDAATADEDAASPVVDAAAATDAGPDDIEPGACNPSECTPTCFRPIRCVTACGGPVAECGCCQCAAGSFDDLACSTAP